jgi:hypothetical protein
MQTNKGAFDAPSVTIDDTFKQSNILMQGIKLKKAL